MCVDGRACVLCNNVNVKKGVHFGDQENYVIFFSSFFFLFVYYCDVIVMGKFRFLYSAIRFCVITRKQKWIFFQDNKKANCFENITFILFWFVCFRIIFFVYKFTFQNDDFLLFMISILSLFFSLTDETENMLKYFESDIQYCNWKEKWNGMNVQFFVYVLLKM